MAVIQTVYRGVKFRSRLEARWAVFYDSLGVRWQYEKEGFKFDRSGLYLPDFWLPDFYYWIEIKGQEPIESERDKASALAVETDHPVFLFYGEIPADPTDYLNDNAWKFFHDGSGDTQYTWCQCPYCGKLGIEYNGRSDRLSCHHIDSCPRSPHGDKGYSVDTPRLLAAYTAARSARFEHGEKGAML